MKIVLISCASTQQVGEFPARVLYKSPLFRRSLAYAEEVLQPDYIYIISSQYHVIKLDTMIKNYDVALKRFTKLQKKNWGKLVTQQLKDNGHSLEESEFTILAGKDYVNPLADHLAKINEPLEGMRHGFRFQFLNQELAQHQNIANG